VDTAATKVEQVLAGFLPLALGFVADFIGLGGLPTKSAFLPNQHLVVVGSYGSIVP
jgi:hypothetical protein